MPHWWIPKNKIQRQEVFKLQLFIRSINMRFAPEILSWIHAGAIVLMILGMVAANATLLVFRKMLDHEGWFCSGFHLLQCLANHYWDHIGGIFYGLINTIIYNGGPILPHWIHSIGVEGQQRIRIGNHVQLNHSTWSSQKSCLSLASFNSIHFTSKEYIRVLGITLIVRQIKVR